jgi:hypothetical protein
MTPFSLWRRSGARLTDLQVFPKGFERFELQERQLELYVALNFEN